MFSFIWQLPQNLVGLFMLMWHKKFCKHEIKKISNADGIQYYLLKHVNDCGISLGNYIFLDSDRSVSKKAVKHEYGHQLQSKRLGWLYLIIIGIPSVIGNIIYRKTKFKPYGDYYKQPWEKWADELGNVNRY